jgi:methionine-rich copper-binding protein CopC
MVKAFLTVGAVVSIATATMFHTELKSSIPAKNSSGPAPTAVSVTFSEAVKVAVSSLSILKSDSTLVEKLVIKEKADAATFGAPVTKPLTPGKYLVRYRTVSDDGHAVSGYIPFSVVARQ